MGLASSVPIVQAVINKTVPNVVESVAGGSGSVLYNQTSLSVGKS